MKQNFKKGFTLIELLVVIAIIGILAAITVVSVSGPRNKATDTKRLSELRQVAGVMEQYWGDKTNYNATGVELTGWSGGATTDLDAMLSYLGTPLPESGDSSQEYKVGSCNGTTLATTLGTGATGYMLYVESKSSTGSYIYCKNGANCGYVATASICS